jgi:hypothetical protein
MAGHPPLNRTGALRLGFPTACTRLLAIGLGVAMGLAAGPGRTGGLTAAGADGAVEAQVAGAAQACRTSLASRYAADPASLEIWLTPGLRIAIDSGELGSAAVRREGLQFGWMLNGRPAPAPIGLCRTRGDGTVAAIEEQKD